MWLCGGTDVCWYDGSGGVVCVIVWWLVVWCVWWCSGYGGVFGMLVVMV